MLAISFENVVVSKGQNRSLHFQTISPSGLRKRHTTSDRLLFQKTCLNSEQNPTQNVKIMTILTEKWDQA